VYFCIWKFSCFFGGNVNGSVDDYDDDDDDDDYDNYYNDDDDDFNSFSLGLWILTINLAINPKKLFND